MKFVNKMIKNSMEAKDLRIGNYVSVDECSTWAITELDIVAVCTFKGSHKPIPLTEEWLVKFGFNKCGRFFIRLLEIDYLNISLEHGVTTIGTVDEIQIKHIQHVHQLQNLYFALTGEELETTN